ncbi:MAG: SlyX family protein [Pseudomonadota bacterium]
MTKELIDLQTRIAHLERVNEELSDIVADVTRRLVKAETKIAALMDLAQDASEDGGQITFGEKPPHY